MAKAAGGGRIRHLQAVVASEEAVEGAAAGGGAAESRGRRVDHVVRDLTGLSRAAVRGLFDHGCVRLDGRPCGEPWVLAAPGQRVEVYYDAQRRYREKARPPSDPAYRIVHEDADLIVVDKAAGYLTVPTEAGEVDTLVDRLGEHVARSGRRPRGTRRAVIAVHRLDRETSGLLVFAKRSEVAAALKAQFRERKPEREYVALVAGRVERAAGTFRSRLTTARNLSRRSTDDPYEVGEAAVTHYRVEALLRGATLVRVRLETGKRNQIRVHFAEAGHLVLGDRRYGPPRREALATWRARRLALHATGLGFEHPATGRALRFESPMPREFEEFVRRNGGRG